MNRQFASGCLIVFILNASSLFGQTAPQSSKSSQEDDIREAVLHHLMQDWVRNADKDETEAKDNVEKQVAKELNFKIFFVSMNDKDPSEDFLKRFQDIRRIVKKVSTSEVSTRVRMPIVDKETQQRGIIFSADRIHWKDWNHVKVEGGYHCDGLCGAGYTFDVKLEKGNGLSRRNE